MKLNFDQDGLIAAIVQDAESRRVLMLAHMDREALRRTLSSGQVWFYSRSRQELWLKGETSGNYLKLRSVRPDCDGDALLVEAEPSGPICHTGEPTCFFAGPIAGDREVEAAEAPASVHILAELERVIAERREERPQGSYTVELLDGGVDRIGKKVAEEAAETIIAAKNGEAGPIADEAADLFYHTLVLLAACGVKLEALWRALAERRR